MRSFFLAVVTVATLAMVTRAAYTAVEVADDAGAVSFGATLDTSLYRDGPGVLKTDGSMHVVQTMNSDTITTNHLLVAGNTQLGTALLLPGNGYAGVSTNGHYFRMKQASGKLVATASQSFGEGNSEPPSRIPPPLVCVGSDAK